MNRQQKRKTLKKLAAVGILGGSGLTGLIRNALAGESSTRPTGVLKIAGEVQVNGKAAQTGMAIGAGDTIVTGSGAQLIYVIGQDAFLQRENSTVSFSGAAAEVMRVLTGKILSVFGKGMKTIETATATIGIRGTGCYIESEAQRVYFCLCYGGAELAPQADPSHVERIETQHHDHPVYIHHDSSMPMMVNASVINHTDAELELLESLVGRKPPFEADSYRN
ncbi:MAG: hypothetical protein WCK63_03365 [Betaproteobacteria bacterium]